MKELDDLGKEDGDGEASEVSIDYGDSELYTKEDMDACIKLIEDEFNTWEGCELHSISYSSDDEANTEDNIKWMNELNEGSADAEPLTEVMMFTSDFHSPVEGGGAWEPDEEYTDYEWWLARSKGGDWKLMTFGY
ncbi:MAG: hypothetical protein K5931_05055 [Lachnospiraceae bacterium]|nr:hypothetical protein [Lachnospiraceae bacterium]